jgi:hypothetical protein
MSVDDEAKDLLILDRVECRDTQISCMAARSLVEPLEACRPQEGLKLEAPKHQRYLAGPLGTHPTGRPLFPT